MPRNNKSRAGTHCELENLGEISVKSKLDQIRLTNPKCLIRRKTENQPSFASLLVWTFIPTRKGKQTANWENSNMQSAIRNMIRWGCWILNKQGHDKLVLQHIKKQVREIITNSTRQKHSGVKSITENINNRQWQTQGKT